jgi:hypothetical protein
MAYEDFGGYTYSHNSTLMNGPSRSKSDSKDDDDYGGGCCVVM